MRLEPLPSPLAIPSRLPVSTGKGDRVTYEEAMARIVALARSNGGTVSAVQVEADEHLSAERELVSAVGRALAGGTNVFSAQESDGREWFPYSSLTFSELGTRRSSAA